MRVINKFRGKYYFLSNFSPIPVTIEEISYPTSEHAFQAFKSEDIEDRKRIAKIKTPRSAKSAGRKLKLRKNWEEIKIGIMENIVKQKFLQNPEFLEKLLDTKDAELIEGNTWKDTFWGVYNGKGENHLGKVLMKVREELKDSDQLK